MGKIWAFIIAIASVYALINGRAEQLLDGILSIPEEAFSFLFIVLSSTIFWTGFMYIFKEVGIIDFISLAIKPLFKKIMPNLKDKEAIEYLSMNIAANMFGLGFAATPSGLKGIKRLKKLSNMPEGVASDEMITFWQNEIINKMNEYYNFRQQREKSGHVNKITSPLLLIAMID